MYSEVIFYRFLLFVLLFPFFPKKRLLKEKLKSMLSLTQNLKNTPFPLIKYKFLPPYYLLIALIFLSIFLTGCQSQPHKENSHTLNNKIWAVFKQEYISKSELDNQLSHYDAILLGETHDNPQHHVLQARIIDVLIQQKPDIAIEMLNQNQQEAITTFQIQKNPITDEFAKVVSWEKTGWPEWSLYRPVFKSTIKNNLNIIAANMSSKQIRKVIKQGAKVLTPEYQKLLQKYQYDESQKKELEKEILSAHCDMLPEKMLSPMLLGQQIRDIAMTLTIQKTLDLSNNKVVLIAGSGHTRTDYGIPYYLKNERPDTKIVSIAFFEVSEDKYKVIDYAENWNAKTKKLPFDYIWFTPRAEREDQCEKMRVYMKKNVHK